MMLGPVWWWLARLLHAVWWLLVLANAAVVLDQVNRHIQHLMLLVVLDGFLFLVLAAASDSALRSLSRHAHWHSPRVALFD
jgi:hypothetical protein